MTINRAKAIVKVSKKELGKEMKATAAHIAKDAHDLIDCAYFAMFGVVLVLQVVVAALLIKAIWF